MILVVEEPLSSAGYLDISDSTVQGLLAVKQLLAGPNLHLERPMISTDKLITNNTSCPQYLSNVGSGDHQFSFVRQ